MSIKTDITMSSLRQRMIEDMEGRQLCAGTQRGHIHSCKRFSAFLNHSPSDATVEDIRRFQHHLSEEGLSICNRNRVMTGVKFLVRVTLRRLDLTNEIYHLREPQKIPLVISQDEAKRLLAMAKNLKIRVLLSLSYGCGLRASEVVRQWWAERPTRYDKGIMSNERLLFPGRNPSRQLTTRQFNRLFHEAADAAGVTETRVAVKAIEPHDRAWQSALRTCDMNRWERGSFA